MFSVVSVILSVRGGLVPVQGSAPSVQGLIGGFPTAFSVIIYHIGVGKINDMQITHSIVSKLQEVLTIL